MLDVGLPQQVDHYPGTGSPIPRHDQQIVGYIKELRESGAFRPVVDRMYRLDQMVEAYTYVETGEKIGNVVITVD